jgi:hypothetical protein
MLTLADLPEGWKEDAVNTHQWVFLDRSKGPRIAVARYLTDNVPEGWVEYYSNRKENWIIVLDREQEVTYNEALHWALTMILLGEAERDWK